MEHLQTRLDEWRTEYHEKPPHDSYGHRIDIRLKVRFDNNISPVIPHTLKSDEECERNSK